jgi:predicted PurR-regulated permease PerM
MPCMNNHLDQYFFLGIFIATILLVGYVFMPFLGALTLALVLAVLGVPVHKKLERWVRFPSLSAFLVTVLIFGAVVVPATFVGGLLVQEARGVAEYLLTVDPGEVLGVVEKWEADVLVFFPALADIDYATIAQNVAQMVTRGIGGVLSNTASLLFSTFVALFALFYFIRDGERFVHALIRLSPLADDEDRQITKKIGDVSRALIRGTLLVAVIQGVLVGIGLWIAGVPNPVLWGAISVIGALIPNVGTGLVNIPAMIYVAFTGNAFQIVFLVLWAFVVVGYSDNLLRPMFIGQDTNIHPLFVLLSVLGGVIVFGMVGLLLGPLLFGLLVALADIYKTKMCEKRPENC